MGILSNLFKQKSAKSKPESGEERRTFALSAFSKRPPESDPAPETDDTAPAPEETADAAQRNISFGNFKRNVTAKSGPSGQETQQNISRTQAPPAARAPDIKSHTLTIVPVKNTAISDKQIAIDIDDLLPQIPAQFLKTDPRAGAKKPLLFNTYELLPFLSQGKATASLSHIAKLAPDFFNGQQIPADAQVELPLQKIVEQIGVFPNRPDQVEEVYPPLDARFAKLVLEKGGSAPVVFVEAKTAAKTPAIEPSPQPAPAQNGETPVLDEKSAVAETGTNGSGGNHVETQPEVETVSYSLASIFPNVPKSWLAGDLKSVDGAERIIVPFDLVETQLATGKVELAFADFIDALPENLKSRFPGGRQEGTPAKVLIPLNEVFQNLPGVEPLPPPPIPLTPELEDEGESSPVSEVAEPEPEIAAEAVAPTEPAPVETGKPVETEKPEPVVAEIPAAAVEEKEPEAEELAEEEIAHEEAPAAAMPAPAEVEKQPEAIQQPAAEPVIEPAHVKAEPAAEIKPVAAVVEEPQPLVETSPSAEVIPAPEPLPEPAPEPPKVQIAPPPLTAYEEPPQPAVPFITPQIHVQRMAPPLLAATKEIPAPAPETPRS